MINPPQKFTNRWPLIKEFMSPETIEKIKMLSGDEVKQLLNYFDPS